MRAHWGKKPLIAGGVAALIVIAAVAALLIFDVNKYKSNIESATSDATGLEVSIHGKMGLSFFPFGVSAKDIHAAGKEGEIISLESIRLGAELLPLLRGQLKVTTCEVIKPAVTIVKDADGNYNFERTEKKTTKEKPGAAFRLNELKLSQAALVFLNKQTGVKIELKGINLATKDLSVADISTEIIKSISFTGSLACNEVRRKDLQIDNVKSPIKVEKGMIYLTPLTMDIFGAKGEGDVTVDLSGTDPGYKINLKVSKLDFAKLEESFGAQKVIGGKGDLDASLTMQGKVKHHLLSSMDGAFSLRGDNLVIYTLDLDKALSSYKTSQKFNLVDLGAFFIAGPLGTVALKGYRYGEVYHQTQGGQGAITQFISHWQIKNGVADATDCALATHHNRVALKGKLDLVNERYENVVVALLGDKGCATYEQGISGSFGSPQIGAVSAVESLAGPILDLYKKAKRFVQGGECEVFYAGAVQHPPE
jgi:AsmA protein